MQSKAASVPEYLDTIAVDKKAAVTKLRQQIRRNIPKGFKEQMQYGMLAYVVPHSIFPAGYHTDPKQPLPFMCLAAQKNFVAIYHMGLYGDHNLLEWFKTEYAKRCKTKLDMGKGCIRLKKAEDIPYDLIGELAGKITVDDYVNRYETNLKTARKKKTAQ